MRVARPVLAVASLVLATAGTGAAGAASTARAEVRSAGACTDSAGITVIVDFGDLPGGTQIGCAPAPVGSGFEALTKAGFSIANVAGSAFLCRIDGQPADDPCNRIPSATRYWGYWHAARGEAWTYSSSGASRKPPAGSVEGWSFGSGEEPSLAPPGPVTPPTTTSPTTTLPPPSTTAPGAPTTVAAGPAGPGGAAPGSPTTAGTADAGVTSTSTTTTAARIEGAAEPGTDEQVAGRASGGAEPAAGAAGAAGSPAGVLATGLGVVALGALAWRTSRRRARDRQAAE